MAHLQHRLRHVELVGVQVAGQPLEVAEHLEAGHAQAASLHCGDRRGDTTFVTGEIARRQHHLPETRCTDRGELLLERARERDRVHAEVVEVHGGSAGAIRRSLAEWLATSSNVTPAEIDLRQRPALGRLDRVTVDEDDAPLTQRAHRRGDVRRTEADAKQALVPLDVLGAFGRLDQLQIEPAARTFEQRALRQDAEILAARQHREAEQVPVEVDPVHRAIAEDRLHDAEVMQARDRRRIRVGAGERHEVDVVDREIAVPIDEIDQAVADAVDSREC